MQPEVVVTVFQQALELLAVLIMVILLPGLAVSLVVAMFQAATQINEATLSFIPKLLITLFTLMLAGPWMLRVILEYTRGLAANVPFLIG